MEGGGRLVGGLDDGHAFQQGYLRFCKLLDQIAAADDIRLRAHRAHRWEFGVGGDGRKPGGARYVMWAPLVSFFSWDHEHNFVVKTYSTVQYGTLYYSQSGVRRS